MNQARFRNDSRFWSAVTLTLCAGLCGGAFVFVPTLAAAETDRDRELPAAATAQSQAAVATPGGSAPTTVHAIGLSAGGSEFDASSALEYQMRRADGWRFGLSAGSGWLRYGFIAGRAVDNGAITQAELSVARTIYRRGDMQLVAHLNPGMRLIRGAEGVGSSGDSNALTIDTGLIADINVSERGRMRAGITVPLSLEITPEVMNDVNGFLIALGGSMALSDAVEAFAELETGGIFGSDGDAGKYLTRAVVGARVLLGTDRGRTSVPEAGRSVLSSAAAEPSQHRIGPFVAMEWRVLGLAGHVSHGPAMQAGVVLLPWLKLGVAGFQRPGPINPATFNLTLPEGMTYRGKTDLALRSDGSVLGVLAAPMLQVPGLPIKIELPVIVGMAGFGFYLHGDDRETPDGRRVSEWEDQLLMGSDSDFSLAVDVGIRAAYDGGWWQPYVGAHYTVTPGYDATMTDDYGGASVTAGVQIGAL